MHDSTNLLSLPPELLLLSLSYLDTRSLLAFSATSRQAHAFAGSSFHTLSLNIHPTRLSKIVNSTEYSTLPIVSSTASVFAPRNATDQQKEDVFNRSFPVDRTVSLLPPSAKNIDMNYLTAFASALSSAVLSRYRYALRSLDLAVWAFDSATATALSRLSSLRILSLRVREAYCANEERLKRRWKSEEQAAWEVLEEKASWDKLSALRLDNVQVTAPQLMAILRAGHAAEGREYARLGRGTDLRELWLRSCNGLDEELWQSLADDQIICSRLEILAIERCGGELDEQICETISKMHTLKFFSLSGVHGLPNAALEKWNTNTWHIPQLLLPQTPLSNGFPDVIEVDPAYM